jgi:hypothetical protein
MKVAYVFSTSGHTASYKLGRMILPQLEEDRHGAEVVGMFFFDDNTFVLREGDPFGRRLSKVAREKGILLMLCDQCAVERSRARRAGRLPPAGRGRGRPRGLLPGSLRRPRHQPPGPGHHHLTADRSPQEALSPGTCPARG